jgi:3-deoxy-D-manno-octulosonic-acid transferase
MRLGLDLLYLLGLLLGSPWLLYRFVRSAGWRDLSARLGLVDAPAGAVWLHGSSVGEVRLLEPLVRLLEQRDLPLIVSSHTATGVHSARRACPGHVVFRFPLDFSFIQRRLMARIRPRLLIVAESDLWPNHLLAAERQGVPVAVINAKLSERSFRLHRLSRIVPRALRNVALVAAQTEAHAGRFEGLGVSRDRIAVTGNMKYDLTAGEVDEAARAALRLKLGFAPDACVIIGGSLHPREDEDLLAAFRVVLARDPGARLVIVPRYPDQAAATIQNAARSGFTAIAWSGLDRVRDTGGAGPIVVVDTLGELRRFYAAADIAFVGGSLYFRGSNKGGHNLMEPAILGLPVLFGPYNFSFSETVADLLVADGGIMVHDRDELGAALTSLVGSRAMRVDMGHRAQRVVIEGRGASDRNFRLLLPLLESTPACSATHDTSQCRHQPQTRIVNE